MTDWIIIDSGLPDPTFKSGGISITNRKVECPECYHRFVQRIERGCFNITEDPYYCPKCEYPYNNVRL